MKKTRCGNIDSSLPLIEEGIEVKNDDDDEDQWTVVMSHPHNTSYKISTLCEFDPGKVCQSNFFDYLSDYKEEGVAKSGIKTRMLAKK